METIVLGFDGSETSVVALDWVAERAAHRATQIEIVMIGGTLLRDDRGRDAGLLAAERRLRDRAPDAQIDAQRFTGKMPDSLVERARGADLLVVGSHRGRPEWSSLSRWMPVRVTSRSLTPVASSPMTGRRPRERSSSASMTTTRRCRPWTSPHAKRPSRRCRWLLVHTWRMPGPRMEGSVALIASPIEARAAHRKILRTAEERAHASHPELVVEQVLEQTDPASALLRAARGASLVVLGTHHRGLVAGAFMGSIGRDVLTQCRVPVCVVPGDSAV